MEYLWKNQWMHSRSLLRDLVFILIQVSKSLYLQWMVSEASFLNQNELFQEFLSRFDMEFIIDYSGSLSRNCSNIASTNHFCSSFKQFSSIFFLIFMDSLKFYFGFHTSFLHGFRSIFLKECLQYFIQGFNWIFSPILILGILFENSPRLPQKLRSNSINSSKKSPWNLEKFVSGSTPVRTRASFPGNPPIIPTQISWGIPPDVFQEFPS